MAWCRRPEHPAPIAERPLRLVIGGLVAWLALDAGLSERTLQFDAGNPFSFHDSATPMLWSFYVQDSVRPLPRMSLDLGVRPAIGFTVITFAAIAVIIGGVGHRPGAAGRPHHGRWPALASASQSADQPRARPPRTPAGAAQGSGS